MMYLLVIVFVLLSTYALLDIVSNDDIPVPISRELGPDENVYLMYF